MSNCVNKETCIEYARLGENTECYICPDYKAPMSNADRIRAMSDGELAEFLCHFRSDDAAEHACSRCKAEPYCRSGHNGMIDWLQQPAEEER